MIDKNRKLIHTEEHKHEHNPYIDVARTTADLTVEALVPHKYSWATHVWSYGTALATGDHSEPLTDQLTHAGIEVAVESALTYGLGSWGLPVVAATEVGAFAHDVLMPRVQKNITYYEQQAKENPAPELTTEQRMLLSAYGAPDAYEPQELLLHRQAESVLNVTALPKRALNSVVDHAHAAIKNIDYSGFNSSDEERLDRIRREAQHARIKRAELPITLNTTHDGITLNLQSDLNSHFQMQMDARHITIDPKKQLSAEYSIVAETSAQSFSPEVIELFKQYIPQDNPFTSLSGKSVRQIRKLTGFSHKEAKLARTLSQINVNDGEVFVAEKLDPEMLRASMQTFSLNVCQDAREEKGKLAKFFSKIFSSDKKKPEEFKGISQLYCDDPELFSKKIGQLNTKIGQVTKVCASAADFFGEKDLQVGFIQFGSGIQQIAVSSASFSAGNPIQGMSEFSTGIGSLVSIFDAKAGGLIASVGASIGSLVTGFASFCSGNIISGVMGLIGGIRGLFGRKKKKRNDEVAMANAIMNHVSHVGNQLSKQIAGSHEEVMGGLQAIAKYLTQMQSVIVRSHNILYQHITEATLYLERRMIVAEERILNGLQIAYDDITKRLTTIDQQIIEVEKSAVERHVTMTSDVAHLRVAARAQYSEIMKAEENIQEKLREETKIRAENSRRKLTNASDKLKKRQSDAKARALESADLFLNTHFDPKSLSESDLKIHLANLENAILSKNDVLTGNDVDVESALTLLRYLGPEANWTQSSVMDAIDVVRRYAQQNYFVEEEKETYPEKFAHPEIVLTAFQALLKTWGHSALSEKCWNELSQEIFHALERPILFASTLASPETLEKMLLDCEQKSENFWNAANKRQETLKQEQSIQKIRNHQTLSENQIIELRKQLALFAVKSPYQNEDLVKQLEAKMRKVFESVDANHPAAFFAIDSGNLEEKLIPLPAPIDKFQNLSEFVALELRGGGHLEFHYQYIQGSGRVELWPEFHVAGSNEVWRLPHHRFDVAGGHSSQFNQNLLDDYEESPSINLEIPEDIQQKVEALNANLDLAEQYELNKALLESMDTALISYSQEIDAAAAMLHLAFRFVYGNLCEDPTQIPYQVLQNIETSQRIRQQLSLAGASQQWVDYRTLTRLLLDATQKAELYPENTLLRNALEFLVSIQIKQLQSPEEVYAYADQRLQQSISTQVDLSVLLPVANFAYQQKHYRRALDYYLKAQMIQQDNGFIRHRCAILLFQLQDYVSAKIAFDELIQGLDQFSARLQQLNLISQENENLQLDLQSQALSRAEILSWRGYTHLKLDDKVSALKDFEEVIALQPHNVDILMAIAHIQESLDEVDHSLAIFEELLNEVEYPDYAMLHGAARCHLQLNHVERAYDLFLRISHEYPNDIRSKFISMHLMMDLYKQGKYIINADDKRMICEWLIQFLQSDLAQYSPKNLKFCVDTLESLKNENIPGASGALVLTNKLLDQIPDDQKFWLNKKEGKSVDEWMDFFLSSPKNLPHLCTSQDISHQKQNLNNAIRLRK